jgi:hypothetical protein
LAAHAATAVCWRSTVAIFRQPSILRNEVWSAVDLDQRPVHE